MHVEYKIYYKEKSDKFKKTHFLQQVSYRETAITVCQRLEADGKKPFFKHVLIED